MTPPTLTPEAKALLASTIRALRQRLLRDLADEAERRYRFSVPIARAGLDEAHRHRRQRIDRWLDERVRAGGAAATKTDKDREATRRRFLQQAVKEAAATLLNRLVLLRHLEALGLSRPAVVTGGWNSKGYQELRDFAPALTGDETEGYATLLQLVFDDLAIELPGLFGDVGLTRLFVVPPATLREVVSRLDDEGLASAWTDDTTLGWVYQYWNDPEREALDAKIADGGKIQPHEIASKTQMFTERYMVEWLLQNSLGLTWLCICRRNGWTPDADRVLPALEARRIAWRARRDAGEVPLDALMPIEGPLEEAWKYYVPQPLPPPAPAAPSNGANPPNASHSLSVDSSGSLPSSGSPSSSGSLSPERGRGGGEGAPRSIRDLRLLDPACGSGHFLTAAFDLLVLLYREEARHRGETWSDADIADQILARNLHGIDIDPRAVQIAAAGLYLKAKTLAPQGRLTTVNLVAPTLQLGNLPDDDPALVQLRHDLKAEAGIPEELTRRLVSSLAGVDHLGTLLKVDAAVDEALRATDLEFERDRGQGDFFTGFQREQMKLSTGEAKATVLDKLEQFLSRHSGAEDLGLRLDGEQLAAGVRFVRMAREGTYDVVVGNPPYQGLARTELSDYVAKTYPRGKADMYAAFLVRGVQLCRPAGLLAMVTMQGWMFLQQFADLRRWVLGQHFLRTVVDLMWCAFENMRHATVSMAIVVRSTSTDMLSVAIAPTNRTEREESLPALRRKRAGLIAQIGRFEFDAKRFAVIDGEPIVYWWSKGFLDRYAQTPKLGAVAPVRQGAATSDNVRFLRRPWEISIDIAKARIREWEQWVPYIKGAQNRCWFEPLSDVVNWRFQGLEVRAYAQYLYGSYTRSIKNEDRYFSTGIAFAAIGAAFSARLHRYPGVIDIMGQSVFPPKDDVAAVLCSMNSATARGVLQSLNPTIHFQVGDVNRLPVFPVQQSDLIISTISAAFEEHEAGRETSIVEFRGPALSRWAYARDWAQRAVDRDEGVALPSYKPTCESPGRAAFVSHAVGVAVGRFGAAGEGILDIVPSIAALAGILFVANDANAQDTLNQAASAAIHVAWSEHGAAVGEGDDLRTYLRTSFFDYHKRLYENRPIYFPLSSGKKSYVAFISIHRWRDDTLQVLLADHLLPEKRRLEGEREDLRQARGQATGRGKAEKRFAEVGKLLEELSDFIEKVTAVATFGPPPPDDKTPRREVDAPYVMDLDDGVMVNSAALWPLLEPQWKDPKKWWRELATAQGRKDYDWAHLSARYFPARVREKCVKDPSLAVAHKCFWELHPAKAYAWELRLQDEIRPDFTIDEPGSDEARARFLQQHPTEARDLQAKETQRRARKAAKAGEGDEDDATPLLNRTGEDDGGQEADA